MSRLHPAVAAVRTAVAAALAEAHAGGAGPQDGDLVLVACSGGADSLALAAATAHVAPRRGLRAGAVVVDHGWHPGSAEVTARVGAICRRLPLDPVVVVAAAPDAAGGGPEAQARRARYAALEASRAGAGARLVLLGHTLDDQAETVLLGLARGAGARSLAGMAPRRDTYVRPLLQLSRATTRQACAALGLEVWDDPANANPAYARVRVRQALGTLEEALGPGVAAALARTAGQLREDADALDAAAAVLLAGAAVAAGTAVPAAQGGPGLDAATLAAAPDAVRRRALLAAARAAGARAGSLSRRHALALDALVTAWSGQGAVDLPGRVVAVRRCGTLCFAPRGAGPWAGGREGGRATIEQEDRAGE